jgi:sulfur relay (sulfurtransferase) DsrF/TusC family protein
MALFDITKEEIDREEKEEEACGEEREKDKGPMPDKEWLRSQILGGQMCTIEFLVYFAILELYAETTYALYMQLEKRGKLLWDVMMAIRGWEQQQMEMLLGGNYIDRVLDLIVEYIGWEATAYHIQRRAVVFIMSTCRNFLVYFAKDAVAELFHYTWAPQILATSNPDNNKLQYYYSLLVFYYEKLWQDEKSMLERHLDLEDLIRWVQTQVSREMGQELLTEVRK